MRLLKQSAEGGRDMLFFFPFAIEPAAAPAKPAQRPLPMLPAPRTAGGFASAMSEAGQFTVDLLKQALGSITSSMTALGNRANAFFAQIVAALAFERIARDTASFFGMVWPGWGAPRQTGFAGLWTPPVPEPSFYSAFGLPGYANSGAANPWALIAEAAKMWTSFWMPAPCAVPAKPAAAFFVPGFAYNFARG